METPNRTKNNYSGNINPENQLIRVILIQTIGVRQRGTRRIVFTGLYFCYESSIF